MARAAWESVAEVYRSVLKRDDVIPGMVAGIQTFRELIHFHPHIHAIATDGAFTPDGVFLCLPNTTTDILLATWQTKVFDLLLAAGKIDRETVDQMRSWAHSGFSVDNSVYLSPGDTSGLERLAEYILRCPFSLARVVRLSDDGSVILSFIERSQQDLVERILRHCGLWEGPIRTLASARAPPHRSRPSPDQPQLVMDPEFLESERLERQADAACELQLVLDPDFL